jgi:hypothetical protein
MPVNVGALRAFQCDTLPACQTSATSIVVNFACPPGNKGRTLVLYNEVTRATHLAKLAPGTLTRVEVIGKLPRAFAAHPTIGDLLP